MNAALITALEPDESEFVELDPTGRYGRYNEILGKGAAKTVYRAFDEYEGIEVAWNQVKLYDFLRSPDDLERLYCEIHLLKNLKHSNIMKFYTSWVDADNRNLNFVTEMFTSGTLRQYRQKHKRVHIRAVKHWCRQILNGLLYLHSHDPPIIHRDLKCDNIFVNGNQGEVKIGDLGLAAILRKSHAARCVGTPEFMAPEVYAEEYNELVDIYAFGMCILEMVTLEYPYGECFHPAQIYKKVISGKKPDALYKVTDPEVRQFIEKCLATVSCRLPARELLKDPFLCVDDYESGLISLDHCRDVGGIGPMLRQSSFKVNSSSNSLINGYSNYLGYEAGIDLDYIPPDFESNESDLLKNREDEHFKNVSFSIKGRREDDGIFLRLRMADKEGQIRNIYFPFDMETDTAMSVAAEMVAELDITDQEVTKIAEMINGEIISLVPEWNKISGLEENPDNTNCDYCQNCASSAPSINYLSPSNPCAKNLQVLHCSRHGSATMHGLFEEITYQLKTEQCVTEPVVSSQSHGMQYSDDENEQLGKLCLGKEEKVINMDSKSAFVVRKSLSKDPSPARYMAEDYDNEIRQELRWLKAKYQMQLRELRDQQLGVISRNTSFSHNADDKKEHAKDNFSSISSSLRLEEEKNFGLCSSVDAEKNCANQRSKIHDAAYGSYSPEHMVTARSFYTGDLLPQSLHRATSLPVDAVDF